MVSLIDDARLLTCAETAEVLGVTMGLLSQWRKAKKGPEYVGISGVYLYYDHKVREFKSTYRKNAKTKQAA